MSYFLNTAEISRQAIHRISWARLGMTLIAFRDRGGTEILVHSACFLPASRLTFARRGREEGILSYISHISVCDAQKGMVLEPFWRENGYRLYFDLESGMVFERTTYGFVWTSLSFQFRKRKKEKEICEFQMDFSQEIFFVVVVLNLSNDDIIS